jgi:hypothetical protein
MFMRQQFHINDSSGPWGDNILGELTAIKHILWSAESGNLPHYINNKQIRV